MSFPTDSDLLQALTDTTEPSASTLAQLHNRLEADAGAAGVLDVAYTIVPTPVGELLIAATELGLVRVAYEREHFDTVLATLSTRISPRILRAPQRLAEVEQQIGEYFAGERTAFDLALDFRLSAGFRRQVQEHLPTISYGSTQSYKTVAELIGNPKAVRAVGSACSTNPLPVVVPCHRVVRTDGTLGGYIGGLTAKTTLLHLEHTA